MARGPRKKSRTGVYHVMIRGVNKSPLFFDDEDRMYFILILFKVKEITNFILYAYCLMDNHVHLVIQEGDELLPEIMKRINVRYASYLNKKYNRVGHLFQGRYRSEEIESDHHLLACTRYVHNNPCKANIVLHPQDYQWSSYLPYVKITACTKLVSTDFILGYFGGCMIDQKREFILFSNTHIEDDFLDVEDDLDKRMDEAMTVIANVMNKHNLTAEKLKDSSAQERSHIIREIRENVSISVKDLADLLGISIYAIYRA